MKYGSDGSYSSEVRRIEQRHYMTYPLYCRRRVLRVVHGGCAEMNANLIRNTFGQLQACYCAIDTLQVCLSCF